MVASTEGVVEDAAGPRHARQAAALCPQTRHSDHHANAQRPYQALCTYHKAPTLPTGYTGTMLVVLFPKYFDTCLAPVLDELQ